MSSALTRRSHSGVSLKSAIGLSVHAGGGRDAPSGSASRALMRHHPW